MWLFIILTMILLLGLVNQGSKNYELQSRADKLNAQIAQLENDNQQLGYKILYYKTDSYKEKLAREKLGLQLPGESVVIIPGSKGETKNGSAALDNKSASAITTPSNIEQWIEFLFGS